MAIKIALAGNPNCGKTTMFNALTGANQYVGNWPGVTVEKKEGKCKENKDVIVTDLPGIYSLSPYTLEEVVSRDYLLKEKPEAIINLVDATNIERNLYLTTQLLELGIPVVIALNMADLLEKNKISIDTKALEKELGCKVVKTSALKGTGIREVVKEAVTAAKKESIVSGEIKFSKDTEAAVSEMEGQLPSSVLEEQKRWYAIKLLERDAKVLEQLKLTASVQNQVEKIAAKLEEEVAQLFTKYDFLAIPVLDQDERMVGIVTFDDAMDVMVDEATEDITKMAAMSPSETTYFDTSVAAHAKHRIAWLLILMFSSTITGSIITKYKNAFAAIPLLVSFIPMLMDTGGNCGSQSSTLIIRGIALGEIRFSDLFRVMFKEFRVSLIVGVVLALANGLRILIMYRNAGLALVIGLSLVATVIISKLIGCLLPLFAKKLHMDPAIMASPLITTLVDTCSILIYFNIATRIFQL